MMPLYSHHGLVLHLQEEAMSQLNPLIYLSLLTIFFSFLLLVHSQSSNYPHSTSSSTRKNVVHNIYHPNANLSSTWRCKPEPLKIINTSDTSNPGIHILFTSKSEVASFECGFYCAQNVSNICYFGILISPIIGVPDDYVAPPQVVWLANRNHPVSANSTLEFNKDGNLALFDADNMEIWSTNTGGKSAGGLNLTDMGNLVLFDSNNQVVWQSFDHPTDVLLLGQKLFPGQRLISSAPDSILTEGMYSLVYENGSLVAYIQSNPPQLYYSSVLGGENVKFKNGSFIGYTIPPATTPQLMKLDSDGHLRLYSWSNSRWDKLDDLFHYLGFCQFPMACGKYGICSNAQCSCPVSSEADPAGLFRLVNSRQPNLGCEVSTPLSCEFSNRHFLLKFENLTYFDISSHVTAKDVEVEKCKDACLRDCSCKAAIFQGSNEKNSRGFCSLINEVFSLKAEKGTFSYGNSAVFLKVQKPSNRSSSQVIISSPKRKSRHSAVRLGSSLGGLFAFLSLLGTCFITFVKCRKSCKIEEVYLDKVPGMPSRFSYEDLKALTNNFTSKIGEGGFGSVFEGTLKDGQKVAVKRLDGLGLAKKSFLAEVETIGSIHHVNLVRLIGFCAENSHRLLVYEFICNGSLDNWIFRSKIDNALRWILRKRIILDIAKGLAYLHEDCRQKIVHLDIKPQNILLDKDFNAKVSDFGLSKLIDKDQSQVVTTLKGTFGYMAPEWLSSVITEKVDVYSFGVMVLEILCGRKNLDWSRPEEDAHLLRVFKKKAENDELHDLVDVNGEDMVLNGDEVVQMMKLAAWCLQNDFRKRPSISDVIRVLEGTMEVHERDLDYDFLVPPGKKLVACQADNVAVLTTLLPSVLSGPR